MFTTYFSSNQVLWLLVIALLHIISIFFFTYKKNTTYALFFLFAGGLIARIVIITFDSYLHLWDEQYHALVAKNMAENPFTPMLFKYAPLYFNPADWSSNHIWLHKQPLFLWQMALSIKLFGATPFAVRLPSAIMTLLLILVIFRIGKISINAQTGYLASFLFAVCNYLLDFNTGQYNTDHNDIAFIFYIALSIWAYTEYRLENKLQYIWLIGFFAGLAILNKWLTGLVVFSGWTVALLFIRGIANKKNELRNILKALAICLLTFLPWQIYKSLRFPLESAIEYKQYAQHFTEPLDGHSGNMWYHFNQAVEQYGHIAYILPIALLILFWDIKNTAIRISYITFVIIVYLFFTVSQTKMPAFCLIVAPILFLALGNLLNRIISYLYLIKINKHLLNSAAFLLLTFIAVMSFDIETLQANHTDWIKNDARAEITNNKIRAAEFGKSIRGKYDEKKTVIVNCNATDNIPVMFFSGYTAYDRIPSSEEYDQLKKNGYTLLYLHDYSSIHAYIINDPNFAFINNISKSKRICLKTLNDKYICADGALNNLIVANRDSVQWWEIFTLILFEKNQCAFLAYNNRFLSAELGKQNEITATRKNVSSWETFSLVELDSNRIALKAANGKYLSMDEKSLQLFARGETIGKLEKFEMIVDFFEK